MNAEYKAYYQSPIGLIEIVGTAESIRSLNFVEPDDPAFAQAGLTNSALAAAPALADCLAQLDQYFKGERREFDLTLDPAGTTFQKSVWDQLLAIPYGQTVSYIEIARRLGNEKTVRAVGLANGQNPISLIIPCHRVIGSNGDLVGYGGGLWRKEWLLIHEGSRGGRQMKLL
jgi:methylated-DNA-[protein]-cysteine S-methyltransferase